MVKLNNKKNNHVKEIMGDKIFNTVNYIFLIFCLLVVLYPLLYILACSFSNAKAIMAGKVWLWPVDFDLTAYKAVFNNKQIGSGYLNSLYYMVVGTVISVFLTILLAYPLSRKEFYGRNLVTKLILFTMMFSGGTIPLYLVIQRLGIYDTRWSMILPSAVGVWNVAITRTFLKENITDDLYEAAEIDGCSDIRFLFQMVIPLSGAILAVLALFYAVGQWNKYFEALLYLQSQEKYPLQLILRNILIQNQGPPAMVSDAATAERTQGLSVTVKYALIVVASVPLLVIYPFVQRFFVQGVMIGSVKG